jgi:hypothetical protein
MIKELGKNDVLFYQISGAFLVPKVLRDCVYKIKDGDKALFIENISKVNLFTGSNNSGKSKILREILKENKKLDIPSNSVVELINNKSEHIQNQINNLISEFETQQIELNNAQVLAQDDFLVKIGAFRFTEDLSTYLEMIRSYFHDRGGQPKAYYFNKYGRQQRGGFNSNQIEHVKSTLNKIEKEIVSFIEGFIIDEGYKKIYITNSKIFKEL